MFGFYPVVTWESCKILIWEVKHITTVMQIEAVTQARDRESSRQLGHSHVTAGAELSEGKAMAVWQAVGHHMNDRRPLPFLPLEL